jgi:hypothetical protein
MPAPIAVKICTENAAARAARDIDNESRSPDWSIYPAVLSGIVCNCTSGLAAFRRANRMEHCGVDAGLKMPAQTSIVIS